MNRTRHRSEAKLNALYRLGQELVLLRDEQAIAETVLEIAEDVLDFGDSEFMLVDESGQELFVSAYRGDLHVARDLRLPLDGERGITVAAARRGEPMYVPDVGGEPRYVDAGFAAGSELAVPVQIEGRVLGVINVESRRSDAYTSADRRLLSTLASQAALALQNARHYTQERRGTEQMAAINRIARRISATLDLRDTLDSIVEAAYELMPCALAEISLWDEGRQMLTLQALRCGPERAFPIGKSYPPGTGYTGWVVRHKEPLLVADVDAREDIRPDLLPGELPFRAYLGVPLIAGDELIGTLVLVHDRARGFDEDDLALLDSLAGQAAVAIRNAGLYEELARRHRELAALHSVAEAANRPLGLEELLQKALDRVMDVTEADAGGIRLLDPSAHEVVLAAHRGLSQRYIEQTERFAVSEEIVGAVALSGEPALSQDMQSDPRISPEIGALLKEEGYRCLAQVPLRAQHAVVGTLGVAASEPGFFDEDNLELLSAIGEQLGVAIANAQLFDETERRSRELAALNAVAVATNRALDLDTLLVDALERVIECIEADGGGIRLLDPSSGELTLSITRGMSEAYVGKVRNLRMGEGIVGDVALTGEPALLADMREDPRVPSEVLVALKEEGLRAFAVVPLRSQEVVVGTLGVVSPAQGAFGPADVRLLTAIGYQIGVAIANAQLRQEAVDAERLAAVGRVAASVAHELRSPLGGIMRSAEFLARPELSEPTRRKLSSAIVAMARRLINTSQELLDYTRGGRMALNRVPCSLPDFLEEVLEVLRVDFSDRGIAVENNWGYRGRIRMDPDRMAQVVYNIAANARDAMAQGGQMTVATERAGQCVELRFTDTGPGVPEALRERIFQPFVSYGKEEGAGLGLAIAERIVQEHGGEIEVETAEAGGATFVVRLPLS